MADYKELLRRAIAAQPENNGTARRAVYEKARSALVGQLRAITPPLPAREITQHRLQLEDCIRQVEQEASEAVITLGREPGLSMRQPYQAPPPPEQPVFTMPAAKAADEFIVPPPPSGTIIGSPKAEASKPVKSSTIEDIIGQAAAAGATEVTMASASPPKPILIDTKPEPLRPVEPGKPERPLIMARADAGKSAPTSPLVTGNVRPIDTPLRGPGFEPRRDGAPLAANSVDTPARGAGRVEPLIGGQGAARQQSVQPLILLQETAVETALSSVREVEVEPVQPGTIEAEGAIERAIETLDREARGEASATPSEPAAKVEARPLFAAKPAVAASADTDDVSDPSFAAAPDTPRTGGGLTIFLVVFVLLLAGVGGAGFWAWREGYVDLDQMFGRAEPLVAETTTPVQTEQPTLDPVIATDTAPIPDATGPGNTAATEGTSEPTSALEGLEPEERLEPTPEAVVPDATQAILPSLDTPENKGEERLPGEDATVVAPDDLTASVDPAVLAGSQSLLLEASADGRTGAVPFSGTIEWSEGVDEIGLPTLIGRANIPARNLGVNLTIRKNADPSLPASHLMEVDFNVNESFIGGTIAGLPGVLLKNAELVPGTPLVGASARVVGNSFLFALSASAADAATNVDLLESRKWMDLAIIYGTGRNAIITLEKDDAAQAMFDKVFAAWNAAPAQ